MATNSDNGGCGCSFFTIGVVFVILKLTGVIAWSWWWVTLPFWITIAFVIACMLFGAIITIALGTLITIFKK